MYSCFEFISVQILKEKKTCTALFFVVGMQTVSACDAAGLLVVVELALKLLFINSRNI